MNTFLVSGDFKQCARILDMKRLNRQLTETVILAKTLLGYKILRESFRDIPFTIQFPPAMHLWIDNRGIIHFNALRSYFTAMQDEWKQRSKNIHGSIKGMNWNRFELNGPASLSWPRDVYFSHRTRLLDKDYNYYHRQFIKEKLNDFDEIGDYVWEGPET